MKLRLGKKKFDEYMSKYNLVLIDPGIYDLTNDKYYKWEWGRNKINFRVFLNTLPENHYVSWDYPIRLNEKQDKELDDWFLNRSFDHALEFCSHPQYIVCVQAYPNNIFSFQNWFMKYNALDIASDYMGIANFNVKGETLRHMLPWAFKFGKVSKFHLYGISISQLKYAQKLAKRFKKEISVDNSKWTTNSEIYDDGCKRPKCVADRQLFFDHYIQKIENMGILLE